MECKNCGNTANEIYCPFCAQKTKVDRITFKTILEELSNTIFQVNRGFLFTIKELFTRPGHTIREYLEGKRKNHFKPLAFVFTISTIYFILSQWFDVGTLLSEVFDGFSQSAEDKNDEFEATKVLIEGFEWLTNNYAYTILILLPLYSLASYISFLGIRFNYLEHIALNAYISGQQAIIYIFFVIISLFFENLFDLDELPLLVSALYTFWVFRQIFSELGIGSVILRTVLSYILYAILIFGLIIGFGIVFMIFNHFTS